MMRQVLQEKSQRVRIEILLKYGYSYDLIQTVLKCSPNTISLVKKKIEESQQILVEKSGPKLKITKEIQNVVLEENFLHPSMSLRKLSSHLQENNNIEISKSSIDTILLSNKCWYGPMINEPKLSEDQKVMRMNFAYTILKNNIDPTLIGFSDESRFQMDSNRIGVWHHLKRYNPLCVNTKAKYSPSIMIWAMIGQNYKSDIIFIEKTMNKEVYLNKIINTEIIPTAMSIIGDDFIFQQDGATSHTTPLNIASIQKQCNIMLVWPPNSPDMNIIELLWAIIKYRIDQERPKNLDELKTVIIKVWDELSLDTINGLVDDFRRRCLLVLQNKGDNIQKYISGGNLKEVTDAEISEIIDELNENGIELTEIPNIIGEKITEEEFD